MTLQLIVLFMFYCRSFSWVWSSSMETNLRRFVLFVYICIVYWDPIFKRVWWDPINRFNPATCLYLSDRRATLFLLRNVISAICHPTFWIVAFLWKQGCTFFYLYIIRFKICSWFGFNINNSQNVGWWNVGRHLVIHKPNLLRGVFMYTYCGRVIFCPPGEASHSWR